MSKETTTKKAKPRKTKASAELVEALAGPNTEPKPEEQEQEAQPKTMSTTLRKYAVGYQPTIAYSGRVSKNKGDEISTVLAGRSPEDVLRIAEVLLGLEDGELQARYEKLNPGQRRMNGGNRIRAAIKRGDTTIEQLKSVA